MFRNLELSNQDWFGSKQLKAFLILVSTHIGGRGVHFLKTFSVTTGTNTYTSHSYGHSFVILSFVAWRKTPDAAFVPQFIRSKPETEGAAAVVTQSRSL